MEAVASQGLLPEFADTRQAQLQLLGVAEREVLAMWARLGLTIDVEADRTFAIWIGEPQR